MFPSKFKFPKVVRILAFCTKFVNAFVRKWRKTKTSDQEPPTFFNCFLSGQHNLMSTPLTACAEFHAKPLSIQYEVHSSYYRKFKLVCDKAEGTHQQCVGTTCHFLSTFRVDEVDIQWALFYLYTKATAEVDKFCKPDKILRDMFRLGGILFHKSRIADGRRYMMSASMKNIESVAAQNINLFTPVADHWSPSPYSLADWIHTDVSIHSGHKSTFRKSLNFCFILQGLSLFEEIGMSCVFCTKLRAKFIQATMGPKDPSAYALAPPFWVTQADLYGPIVTYVPGRERNTRAHRDLTSKCWAMVFVCNLSKAVHIQVVEGHDAHHLADGLTRLCCEVGAPARLLIDRDSGASGRTHQHLRR